MIAFRHMVAAQANEGQKAQFDEVFRTMHLAIQQAVRLHTAAGNARPMDELVPSATVLRDAIYDAQHENFLLLKSLTDTQEAELRSFTAKLRKANQAVGKTSDALNDEISRRRPDTKRVAAQTASLQKELTTMHSDQLNLAQEMGIRITRSDTGHAEPNQ